MSGLANNRRSEGLHAIVVFIALCGLFPPSICSTAQAKVIFVSPDGNGQGGETWGTAFPKVFEALVDATTGDEIWVEGGTYSDNIEVITAPVTILGGFSGTETVEELEMRDWRTNVTTIDSTDRIKTPLYCRKNAYVDGVILTSSIRTPGIFAIGSNCQIRNCTVENCYSQVDGGGALIDNSTIEFTNCVIRNNRSPSLGGGLRIENSLVTMQDCVIEGNRATQGGGFVIGFSRVLLNNCTIGNNIAFQGDASGGGGVAASDSVLELENCLVHGNSADIGQQLLLFNSENGSIRSSTILGESRHIVLEGGSCHFDSCILAGANDLFNLASFPEVTITNSNIQGGYPGEGNISDDPLFRDPANGDFRLQYESPCIDAGAMTGPADDLDGNPRPIDIPGLGREGDNAFDMGAFEFQLPIPPPDPRTDINQDGLRDATDLLLLLQDWHRVSGPSGN